MTRVAKRRARSAQRIHAWPWFDYHDMSAPDVSSCVYLLIWRGEIVYIGQTSSIEQRVLWHHGIKQFDAIRILPIDGPKDQLRRVRTVVEQHIRDLVGDTFYPSGESVRDRIEMAREGPPIDAAELSGTKLVLGVEALLRWLLG